MPHYRVINAAFTHANPLGARFSTPERGAWYAAFELATAKAEVLFHKSIEFAEIDWKEREEIGYDDYLADFTAAFHDLRGCRGRGPKPRQLRAITTTGSGTDGAWLAWHCLSERTPRRGNPALPASAPALLPMCAKAAQYRLIWTPQRAPHRAPG